MIINATNIGRHISGISRYSLSVSLYLLDHWDFPFQLFINAAAQFHFNNASNADKIRVVSKYVSPDFNMSGHLLRLLWANKLCIQNKNDLVFNTSQLEGSLWHKRQIIMVHDLLPLIFPQYHKKQYYYFKYVLPRILRNSMKILTVSQYTKHQIVNFYKIPEEKICVIYNGIDDYFLNQTPNYAKQDYILYVGRISPTKNIINLIKAFEMLVRNEKFALKLKLTGSHRDLNFKIDEKVRNQIEFISNVSDKELVDLYKNARLLIFPSLCEGFGFPPLEAMACGCPVVTSHVASLPEVCGDAACYVDPYNVESIAEGIRKVAFDEGLSANLIQNGQKRAALFSLEKSVREHIKVFEEGMKSIH